MNYNSVCAEFRQYVSQLGTKKGRFHPIYSGSCGYGSGWRCVDHEKRLLLSETLPRETLPGPDVRLFVLADEQGEGENASEVVVFYRAPRVPRPIFKQSTGPRHFHSKLAPQSLVFGHYRAQKRGKSCRSCPRKRLDSIQFFANKMLDLQFSFGSQSSY